MRDQIRKYTQKLLADRSAVEGRIAFAAQDDMLICDVDSELAGLAAQTLERLSSIALVIARPSLPFADFLVRRARNGETCVNPTDTETRTFLHDIPILRQSELADDPAAAMARLLSHRKGIIVEGLGIAAIGAVTVEQAYINYSSVFHSTFVKYLLDLLREGACLPDEEAALESFRSDWLRSLDAEGLYFRKEPLSDPDEICREIAAVGRYTVERGLVDSFFGNISCRAGDVVYISQTAASLDELPGCIDPVPMDNSSTTGITASSELLAHRMIYEATGANFILHGHPKFSVVMSMLCEEGPCEVSDCWKDCPKVRWLGQAPVVAGEIGAGGLARRVSPVIGGTGSAIVYGHGVFTVGMNGFDEAFSAMVDVENWCRLEYFRRIAEMRILET